MSLSVGTKLGPYQIKAPIGAGGMGEVYRARDTKLDREVALKVLPSAFASDAERLVRFQREALVLASLNPSQHRRYLWAGGMGRHPRAGDGTSGRADPGGADCIGIDVNGGSPARRPKGRRSARGGPPERGRSPGP
jgi:hypothetical protein